VAKQVKQSTRPAAGHDARMMCHCHIHLQAEKLHVLGDAGCQPVALQCPQLTQFSSARAELHELWMLQCNSARTVTVFLCVCCAGLRGRWMWGPSGS
jgi:hypothetical protein